MRLLVLDESQLLAWMVERLAPPGTLVTGLTSFDEARRVVQEDPPDAAVVSLTSAHLPWREFARLCAAARPRVPILWESCIFGSAEEAGLDPAEGDARFLRTPASRTILKEAVERLLDDAREARTNLVFQAANP
ncbi:MAG TPA: hypothetical protein PK598_01380 [Thermoanaerobaculia bacterium]|nr:hypothetical protein [Thermoanaerobaculia bacterium]